MIVEIIEAIISFAFIRFAKAGAHFRHFRLIYLPGEHFKIIENIIPSLTAAVLHIKIAFIAQWVGYKHICRLTKQQIIGRIGLRGMDRASVNGSEVAING